jgi:UDP-GlcNAc:undecaprenyl-phosphate GlcNAc-1-phosphate transferase
MIMACLLLGLLSLVVSLPLTRVMAHLGRRWGQLDQPGREAHKRQGQAIPTTGGIAIVVALLVPAAAALALVWLVPIDAWAGPLAGIGRHVPGLRSHTGLAIGFAALVLLMHAVGLVDDRRGLGAWPKLLAQGAVALVVAWPLDTRVLALLDAWGPAGSAASLAVTVLWIVAITNAMNMLDNMDGLSAGVGAVIAAVYLAATLIQGQWFVAAACALLLGALLGFLVWNFPPARLYMGDAGSLVLGLALAVISIRTTYVDPQGPGPWSGRWYGLLMPLVVMAVPLYDLGSVTLIRLLQGRSPFVGDQQHFSHRLVRRGLSRRVAVVLIWLMAATTGVGGVMLGRVVGWQAALIGAQTLMLLGVIAMLEWAGRGGGGSGDGGA